MNNSGEEKKHELHLEDQKHLSLTGVKSVSSYTEKQIILETLLGGLILGGEKLDILELNLDGETMSVKGKIKSIRYAEPGMRGKGKGVLGKLFK